MEVYVLDNLLRRIEVIDQFESLIWTERWSAWGDFEMKIHSTFNSRSLLTTGTRLSLSTSFRVMVIETIEDKTLADGTEMLELKGRSLESIFEDRVAHAVRSSLTVEPTWNITGAPGTVMRKLVHDICVTGVMSADDKIPYLIEERHPALPINTLSEPIEPITVKLEPQPLYGALTKLSNIWSLGFRMLLETDVSKLYFDVYAGVDRTLGQSTRPPVVFSPELDNLQNITELSSVENVKNVAYVFSPVAFKEVDGLDVPPDIDGFDRRVLIVKADDITEGTNAEIDQAMIQRGREALAEYKAFWAFDGEINQNSQYIYGTDYNLGDLVEFRNKDGMGNRMRVTEQIFVSDKEGERAYPTLTIKSIVTTGSWRSEIPNKKWIDYDADTTTVWATLP